MAQFCNLWYILKNYTDKVVYLTSVAELMVPYQTFYTRPTVNITLLYTAVHRVTEKMTKYTTMAKNKCAVIRASIDWGKSAQAAQSDFKHQVVFRQNECHLILGHLTHAMYV